MLSLVIRSPPPLRRCQECRVLAQALSQSPRKSRSSSGGFNQNCAAVCRQLGRTSMLMPRPCMARKADSSVESSPR